MDGELNEIGEKLIKKKSSHMIFLSFGLCSFSF